ncbi:hypothetical protein chiPu_0018369 [Chiloscyllium punctatum]|uniref:Uncharacterized protein n=1 Tax=Chiloscyllium punctatum TaxID=137246 RepID=A0A401RMQ4_CHIPU|nr:hypothetical protein [Chiloscyllium punctatum]
MGNEGVWVSGDLARGDDASGRSDLIGVNDVSTRSDRMWSDVSMCGDVIGDGDATSCDISVRSDITGSDDVSTRSEVSISDIRACSDLIGTDDVSVCRSVLVVTSEEGLLVSARAATFSRNSSFTPSPFFVTLDSIFAWMLHSSESCCEKMSSCLLSKSDFLDQLNHPVQTQAAKQTCQL